MDDHFKLLEAIRSKDADAAGQEMEGRIVYCGQLLGAHFDKRMASFEKSDEAPNRAALGLTRV
ncbi:hypothetical protein ACX5I6_20575 [Arthrobacter sp. MMS24-T111]